MNISNFKYCNSEWCRPFYFLIEERLEICTCKKNEKKKIIKLYFSESDVSEILMYTKNIQSWTQTRLDTPNDSLSLHYIFFNEKAINFSSF